MAYLDEHGLEAETPDAVFVEELLGSGARVRAYINPMEITYATVPGRNALASLHTLLQRAASDTNQARPLGMRVHLNPRISETIKFIRNRSNEKVRSCIIGPKDWSPSNQILARAVQPALTVNEESKAALKDFLGRLDVLNLNAVCKSKLSRCHLSSYTVPTCLPGVLLAQEKGSRGCQRIQYPNLALINENFVAVTKNMDKKKEKFMHPLI